MSEAGHSLPLAPVEEMVAIDWFQGLETEESIAELPGQSRRHRSRLLPLAHDPGDLLGTRNGPVIRRGRPTRRTSPPADQADDCQQDHAGQPGEVADVEPERLDPILK